MSEDRRIRLAAFGAMLLSFSGLAVIGAGVGWRTAHAPKIFTVRAPDAHDASQSFEVRGQYLPERAVIEVGERRGRWRAVSMERGFADLPSGLGSVRPVLIAGPVRIPFPRPVDLGTPLASPVRSAPEGKDAFDIGPVEDVVVDEGTELRLRIPVQAPESMPLRLSVEGLPPGARFDEAEKIILWSPDFTQGPRRYDLVARARAPGGEWSTAFVIEVRDTIVPPSPEVVDVSVLADALRYTLVQRTDAFLSPSSEVGRPYPARVFVPRNRARKKRFPVRIYLHGIARGARKPGACLEAGFVFTRSRIEESQPTQSLGDQVRIYPYDPDSTYWYGKRSRPSSERALPHTLRRVLHILEWTLRRFPEADPDRVYLSGESMGGAGAAAIGLTHPWHFAHIDSALSLGVLRYHRKSRIAEMSQHYGAPEDRLVDDRGLPVWDRLDLTRALLEEPGASSVFIYLRHGVDDPFIYFHGVARPSALTGLSVYEALQASLAPHFAVWHEGGHGSPDPALGARWWDDRWQPMLDPVTDLRRDRPVPAFSGSEADDDPGRGAAKPGRSADPEGGLHGDPTVVGDTGYALGDRAGCKNRFLRWDGRRTLDTWHQLTLALGVVEGEGFPPPFPGAPALFDAAPRTIRVDVTPRRARRFLLLPGEVVRWRFRMQEGVVVADDKGRVSIARLELRQGFDDLVLEREAPFAPR